MVQKLYAVSAQAGSVEQKPRGISVRMIVVESTFKSFHGSAALFAESETDAKERGMDLALETFPREKGWTGHTVSVTEIPSDMVVEAAHTIRMGKRGRLQELLEIHARERNLTVEEMREAWQLVKRASSRTNRHCIVCGDPAIYDTELCKIHARAAASWIR